MSREIVAADIGGTHARFARASVELRMRRQREVLDRPDPPQIDVVLDGIAALK